MQAIILAAGMGKRLKELTQDRTKCMVQVNGVALIDRMLHQIESRHLSRIVIVVGYQGEKLMEYIDTLGIRTPIVYVQNPIYDKTNNIYSLALAKDYLCQDDTLLFESDLIFEDAVIDQLLDDPRETLALVDKYESWMDGTCVKLGPDDSIASFGFRWLQGLDNVHMVLSGMSDMAQMADNVATFEHLDPLSPAEEAILFAAADKMKNSIPCTACRYCCDGCPQQLDIPDLLHKYNQLRTGSGSTIKMQLDAVPANKWPHACLGCGACAAVCPQKIVIPDELAAFAAELDKLPDWVEVCRQRAEAEARERASRGL